MPQDESLLLLTEMKALRQDFKTFHLDFKEGIQSLTNAFLRHPSQQNPTPVNAENTQLDMFATQPETEPHISFPSDRLSDESSLLNEVNKCIGEVKAKWKSLLNNRNQMVKKSIRNSDLVKLYDDWLSREPPFLPASFRPKPTKPENKEIDLIRLQQGKVNMTAEKEIMKLYASNAQKRISEIDDEVNSLASSLSPKESVREKIKETWKKELTEGESDVIKQWEPNHQWHKKRPENPESMDKNPQSDGSREVEVTGVSKALLKTRNKRNTTSLPSKSRDIYNKPKTVRSVSRHDEKSHQSRPKTRFSKNPSENRRGGNASSGKRVASSGGQKTNAQPSTALLSNGPPQPQRGINGNRGASTAGPRTGVQRPHGDGTTGGQDPRGAIPKGPNNQQRVFHVDRPPTGKRKMVKK
jgi:hypothetical protein